MFNVNFKQAQTCGYVLTILLIISSGLYLLAHRFPDYCTMESYPWDPRTPRGTERSWYGLPMTFLRRVITTLPNGTCLPSPNKCVADMVCTHKDPEMARKFIQFRHMDGEYEGPYQVEKYVNCHPKFDEDCDKDTWYIVGNTHPNPRRYNRFMDWYMRRMYH